MPSFPIIDTHLHLWDPESLRYPWLDEITLLNRPFLPDDFQRATGNTLIDKLVFVQCECEFSQCEEEVRWASDMTHIDKRIKGIVAWAPLEKGQEVKPVLDRYSTNNLVKGIRRIIQFESDPNFCLQDKFVAGVQLLARYDFSFDICVSHGQLEKVIKLVQRCPEVSFVLDHIGKPDIKNQMFEPWRSQIKQLAQYENVHCKLSGLVTEADHDRWAVDDLRGYIQCIMESFSPDRLMFGGDWPVAIQASNYMRWIETLDQLLYGLSREDLMKIYYKNAEEFYRLN